MGKKKGKKEQGMALDEGQALEVARFLLPSEEITSLEELDSKYMLRITEALYCHLGLLEEDYKLRRAIIPDPEDLIMSYMKGHEGGQWRYQYLTIDCDNDFYAIESYFGCRYKIYPLYAVLFLLQYVKKGEGRTAEEIFQDVYHTDLYSMNDILSLYFEYEDFDEDKEGTGQDEGRKWVLLKPFILAAQCLYRILNGKKADIPPYCTETIIDDVTVSEWCNAAVEDLDIFSDRYAEAYKIDSGGCMPWDAYLMLYTDFAELLLTGAEGNRILVLSNREGLSQYISWREENKKEDSKLLGAIDRAAAVLKQPFIGNCGCGFTIASRDSYMSIMFEEEYGYTNVINPFYGAAQAVFDALYPKFVSVYLHEAERRSA